MTNETKDLFLFGIVAAAAAGTLALKLTLSDPKPKQPSQVDLAPKDERKIALRMKSHEKEAKQFRLGRDR